MSADAPAPPSEPWLDETPGSHPFKNGDLFERRLGDDLMYYRVKQVTPDGTIETGHYIGKIEGGNAPNVAAVLSQ